MFILVINKATSTIPLSIELEAFDAFETEYCI